MEPSLSCRSTTSLAISGADFSASISFLFICAQHPARVIALLGSNPSGANDFRAQLCMLKVCGRYHDAIEIVPGKQLLGGLVPLGLQIEQIFHPRCAVLAGKAP